MSDPVAAPAPHAPPAVVHSPAEQPAQAKQHSGRRGLILATALAVVIAGGWWYLRSLSYVSTDDAYVNGHATFVAPRISGQVSRVLVDDNNRVRKGDLLVQIDKEPFLVQQEIATAAVEAAKADVVAATALARATVGEARTMRFALDRAIEDVNNQVALLHSKIAVLNSQKATEERAKSDLDRVEKLNQSQATTQQQLDAAREGYKVAKAKVEEALQGIYQIRVSLGLPATPPDGQDLASVPDDINQTFSAVRKAEAALIQAAAQLGITDSFDKSPKQLVADFYKRDPEGNIDRIYDGLIKNAPTVKQAETKLLQAQRQLDQANLNLKYTDVIAEIDGVVTRRNVNPGNNVVAGQSLMVVRSLTEIWVDANFKETQLADLRIGQPVYLDVDMYGSSQHFKGRISGFLMGTGSTLALLPAQNATGNFVKVVQRLPVRIDLIDYDPEKHPLFFGLSVEPNVMIKEKPTGPNAGAILQPLAVVTEKPAASAQP